MKKIICLGLLGLCSGLYSQEDIIGRIIDFFLMALQETAEYIVETINRYMIRELAGFNWNVKEFPVLKVQRIKELDMTSISALKSAGLLTPDAELENTIRKQLGLPEIDEADYEERIRQK